MSYRWIKCKILKRKISVYEYSFIGFYGDALAPKKGDCKPCSCHPLGTLELENGELNCDQLTGHCKCKPHVFGTNCEQCEHGFFDINSGQVNKVQILYNKCEIVPFIR